MLRIADTRYCGIGAYASVMLRPRRIPTYGRTSNRGVIPLSWTLDHVGPLCRTVEDTALLLGVIAGFDALDPASVNTPVQTTVAFFERGQHECVWADHGLCSSTTLIPRSRRSSMKHSASSAA